MIKQHAADDLGATEDASPVTGALRLLTASDVAAALKVPETWVYAQARAGRIPHLRLGRYVRFDAVAVGQWCQGRREGPWRGPDG